MRVLRCSVYADAPSAPLTTVFRDRDLADSIEGAREQLIRHSPHALVVVEIFSMLNGSTQEAAFEALQRAHGYKETEQHMALLYHWSVRQFELLNAGGKLLMDRPAPLSESNIRYVFAQLSMRNDYRDFTIVGIANDKKIVTLVGRERFRDE